MAPRSPFLTHPVGRGRISRERSHVLFPPTRWARRILFLMHCRPLPGLTWSYCPQARRRRLLTSVISMLFFALFGVESASIYHTYSVGVSSSFFFFRLYAFWVNALRRVSANSGLKYKFNKFESS